MIYLNIKKTLTFLLFLYTISCASGGNNSNTDSDNAIIETNSDEFSYHDNNSIGTISPWTVTASTDPRVAIEIKPTVNYELTKFSVYTSYGSSADTDSKIQFGAYVDEGECVGTTKKNIFQQNSTSNLANSAGWSDVNFPTVINLIKDATFCIAIRWNETPLSSLKGKNAFFVGIDVSSSNRNGLNYINFGDGYKTWSDAGVSEEVGDLLITLNRIDSSSNNIKEIIDFLKMTNLNGDSFPWDSKASGRLKAWDTSSDGLIPVKLNNYSIAEEAVNRIHEELGKQIFDVTSIANTATGDIARGLIVSLNTQLGPDGLPSSSCGSVSKGIGTNSYPNNFYDAAGNINTVLWVHLSTTCEDISYRKEIAIHEFAHAIGLGEHFQGYGIGPPIDNKNFWNVLYNMYHNEVGSTADELNIKQIKF